MTELPARPKSLAQFAPSLQLGSISEVGTDSAMYSTSNSQSSFLSDLLGKSKN